MLSEKPKKSYNYDVHSLRDLVAARKRSMKTTFRASDIVFILKELLLMLQTALLSKIEYSQ